MFPLILISLVFNTNVNFVEGQSSCFATRGVSGKCVSLFDCFPLLDKAHSKLAKDLNELDHSKCGSIGAIPAVCCPLEDIQLPQNNCYTPDNSPGKCVNLNLCKHLADLLTPPVAQQTASYIKSLRCNGTTPYSVCCAPKLTFEKAPTEDCNAAVSAYPPDPVSGCCGVDSRVGIKIDFAAPTLAQHPWLALVEYEKDGKRSVLCGGALISGIYVLTAAHCVVGSVLQQVGTPNSVVLGEYDKTSDGPDCAQLGNDGNECTHGEIRILIEKTIPYPTYDQLDVTKRHNIALIRLQETAPYTEFIRPICLPTVDIATYLPSNFFLHEAGWGLLKRNESKQIKSHVYIPFVKPEECQTSYTKIDDRLKISEYQLCAGRPNPAFSCTGNVGMPLIYGNGRTYEVIGVTSLGYRTESCFEVAPKVYTKVFNYIYWIKSVIEP